MVAGVFASEESPGTAGQSAGQLPVKVTLRKVQQRYTASLLWERRKGGKAR